ncbi:hypothetical protein GXW82_15660 [Streptacidiphilus sp. 4-A2]|nr:hypothetical protein [Streptacidiphilus sp. 4-A2]
MLRLAVRTPESRGWEGAGPVWRPGAVTVAAAMADCAVLLPPLGPLPAA